VIGGAGDTMVSGARLSADVIGMLMGVYLIAVSVVLTGRIPSDSVDS
jgi:hypothetical protein